MANRKGQYKIILLVFGMLALAMLTLPSCRPDDDDPGIIPQDSTTRMTFKCYYQDPDTGEYAQNAFVGLAATEIQRDNGIFLFSRTTDFYGQAKFDAIDTITYWYNIDFTRQTQSFNKKGTIKLAKGDKKTLEVVFK